MSIASYFSCAISTTAELALSFEPIALAKRDSASSLVTSLSGLKVPSSYPEISPFCAIELIYVLAHAKSSVFISLNLEDAVSDTVLSVLSVGAANTGAVIDSAISITAAVFINLFIVFSFSYT